MEHKKLTAFEAATYFYNMFFEGRQKLSLRDYLDNSFCDEIGEIDLNTGLFQIESHVANKYANPGISGDYRDFFNYVIENVIHPDDRGIYFATSALENILSTLETSKYHNFEFAHLRAKLVDGPYRWIELASITGEENGLEPGKVRFYVFDIHNTKLRELGDVNDESGLYDEGRDPITGLFNKIGFYKHAEALVEKNKDTDYCLISSDIEHFKLFNEWYGKNKGDYLLATIGSKLNDGCLSHNGLAGYFGQDDFVILLPNDNKLIDCLYNLFRDVIFSYGKSFGFFPAFGICLLKDAKNIVDAYDKSCVALLHAKKDLQNRIYYFNPKIHLEAEEEKRILADFMEALEKGEITFYLQPQCRISTKAIVGAEALARWIKPDGSIIPPGVFVPILEKYSFITDLDKYIWEKVCAWLRSWIDRGHTPVPISLNVSQVDIFAIDIVEYLQSLVDKYQISPSLLKIEITESAYAETTSKVKALVDELRSKGFIILMDDFGSGYSSLNMLKSLQVDAVKLDALFLNITNGDYEKGIHILESVVNMTKTIALPIIVEGVENERQVNFLVDLGCRYVQGFHFYKPMPVEKLEKIIKLESNIDNRGFICKRNDQLKVREFMDENIYSDTMLNNILGPVAFYAWKDEQVDITRFNEQFYEAVNASDFAERLEHIERFVPDEDKPKLYTMFKEASEHKAGGAKALIRFSRIDGVLMTFLLRVYFISEEGGFKRFYGSASDLTGFTDLRQQMSLIARYSSDTIVFLKKFNGKFSFVVAAHGLAKATGISIEELSKELNERTIVEKRFSRGNHIDLKELFEKSYVNNHPFSMPISVKKDDGSVVRIHMKADPVSDQANNVEYIFTFRLLNE